LFDAHVDALNRIDWRSLLSPDPPLRRRTAS
jgi:hypothetical protein